MAAQGVFQAVGLRRDVVDHDHRRGLGIAGRGPAAVLLVRAAFVHGRFDRAACARQGVEFGVDTDPVRA